MIGEQLINGSQSLLLFLGLGCAFRYGSLGCGHLPIASVSMFLFAPFVLVAWAPMDKATLTTAIAVVVVVSFLIGVVYQKLTGLLQERGASPTHAMLVSLAVLGISQNALLLYFGSSSRSLQAALGLSRSLEVEQLVATLSLAAKAVVCAGLILIWHRTRTGLLARALEDSPVVLMLRGISVTRLRTLLAGAGFAAMACLGLAEAIQLRVRADAGLQIAVWGLATSLLATGLRPGMTGLIVAGTMLSAIKLILELWLEGDWTTVTVLLAIVVAAVLGRLQPSGFRHG